MKKEDRRTTSIARRINRAWFFRTLTTLLIVDLGLAALLLAGWCYAAEEANAAWNAYHGERALTWNGALPLWERLLSIQYTFPGENGAVTVSGAKYFALVRRFYACLLGFEAFILPFQYAAGKRKARRLLAPLDWIAQTTQELSRTRFDEEKLHHLEDAIATVSPTTLDAQLKVGDRELRGLEQAINDLLARMREAYREQSRFVSDASHELRTPIAVIQGYADMLSRWGKNDEKVLGEGIAAIQSESAHMKTLIEQLLFLARGDSGKNQMVMKETDLAAMMREVYEESCMLHADRTWRCDADAPVTVLGDAAMLKQTARILVDNAVKYTSAGARITLRARMQGDVPCFEVQDNGIGISKADIAHIFDRFYRSDPARARTTGGTGLGLSIAKWIVDKHKGYIDVFSREEIGTRMRVLLPQEKQAAAPSKR